MCTAVVDYVGPESGPGLADFDNGPTVYRYRLAIRADLKTQPATLLAAATALTVTWSFRSRRLPGSQFNADTETVTRLPGSIVFPSRNGWIKTARYFANQ